MNPNAATTSTDPEALVYYIFAFGFSCTVTFFSLPQILNMKQNPLIPQLKPWSGH